VVEPALGWWSGKLQVVVRVNGRKKKGSQFDVDMEVLTSDRHAPLRKGENQFLGGLYCRADAAVVQLRGGGQGRKGENVGLVRVKAIAIKNQRGSPWAGGGNDD